MRAIRRAISSRRSGCWWAIRPGSACSSSRSRSRPSGAVSAQFDADFLALARDAGSESTRQRIAIVGAARRVRRVAGRARSRLARLPPFAERVLHRDGAEAHRLLAAEGEIELVALAA